MKLTSSNPRYTPIPQLKYCCVPACILMVMQKRGISLVSQELLGNELGLVIPEEDRNIFTDPNIGKPHKAGYGTNLGGGENQINPNGVFEKLKIPLKIHFRYIDQFKDEQSLLEYLKDIQDNDNDALLCFDQGALKKEEKHWGHVCVFDSVVNMDIKMIDPKPLIKSIPVKVLYDSMTEHGSEKGGGVWEFI